jgi:molybdopterin synthase sulfur carrier subunit
MITVLFFADLQEKIGTHEMTLKLDKKELKVHHVKEWIKDTYHLQSLNQVMIAVNESFATDDDVLEDGDTVAFIPPVSGG